METIPICPTCQHEMNGNGGCCTALDGACRCVCPEELAEAERLTLTVDDIETIIDGLDNFCIGPVENEETRAIWQPYIDKLTALKKAKARQC